MKNFLSDENRGLDIIFSNPFFRLAENEEFRFFICRARKFYTMYVAS